MIARPVYTVLLMLALAAASIGAAAAADRAGQDAPRATTSPQAAAALAALLKESRFESTEVAPGTYTLQVPGRRVARHKLFVAAYDGLVLVGTVVAKTADLPKNPDLHARLLRFNHDFDRVKVALDDDGDLVVRVDLTLRVLDAAELRANIEQVAASADEVLTLVQKLGAK